MKLIKAFMCVLPGEIYPVELASGDECPPEYEDSAREQGCLPKGKPDPSAKPEAEPKPAAAAKPEAEPKPAAVAAPEAEQKPEAAATPDEKKEA